jgi:hypothetical protein
MPHPSQEAHDFLQKTIDTLISEGNEDEAARLRWVRQNWIDREEAERNPPTDRRSMIAREHLASMRS